jgi:thiamine biosynthesis lipoprotein
VFYLLCFFLFGHAAFVQKSDRAEPIVVEGFTMGTTYRVVYFDEHQKRNFKHSIDSLLSLVNQAINTYDSTSEISRFNKHPQGIPFELPFLYELLKRSKEIHVDSKGAFDPTVLPLVNAWGFGPQKFNSSVEPNVDSLMRFVGFDKIEFTETHVKKSIPYVQLDMGGIGQGYGADVIFNFLRSKGVQHMLVELGGEGIACGKNLEKDRPWRIGIIDPNSTRENQFFKAYATLCDKAFTTSGNYFNYKVINNRKFGHTIDPDSGYPVQHELLSVSLFADDCTTADGWATAFMVMGLPKAITQLSKMPTVDALLIYSAADGKIKTYVTPRFRKFIQIEK